MNEWMKWMNDDVDDVNDKWWINVAFCHTDCLLCGLQWTPAVAKDDFS